MWTCLAAGCLHFSQCSNGSILPCVGRKAGRPCWVRRKNCKGCEGSLGQAGWCNQIQTAALLGRWFWDCGWWGFCFASSEASDCDLGILPRWCWTRPKDTRCVCSQWFDWTWEVAEGAMESQCKWSDAVAPCSEAWTCSKHAALAWSRC